MAFVNAQLDNSVKEPEAVPEGEYDLRIVKATRKESKKGNMMTEIFIRIEDDAYPNAALVRHYLIDVDKESPPAQQSMRKLDTKRFLAAFGIRHEDNGYDDEDLAGATAHCMLVQEEDDRNGELQNRLRLPRLKE